MASGKILIVDDEIAICKSLTEWLAKEGYTVEACYCAEAVMPMVANSDFDVIMMDIKLPQKTGIDILREIKKVDPHAVVIIMTGFPTDATIHEALTLGAYDYIKKPFNADKIYFVVERAVSYAKLIRQSRPKK